AYVNGNELFRRKLITQFLSSTSSISSDLKGAGAVSDRAALARLAHQLKGASSCVQARVLEDAAIRLEEAAMSGAAESWAPLVQEACARIAESAEFLTLHYQI